MPCWQRMLLQYWLPPSLGSPSGMLTLCRKFGRVAFGPIFEPKCSSSSCSLSSSSGGSEGRSCLPLAETSTLLQFQAHSCAVRAGGSGGLAQRQLVSKGLQLGHGTVTCHGQGRAATRALQGRTMQ